MNMISQDSSCLVNTRSRKCIYGQDDSLLLVANQVLDQEWLHESFTLGLRNEDFTTIASLN